MTPSANPQALPDSDPSPPAINRADGIARLMGDAALFARVLARFRKEYRHMASRIRDALAAGDAELALRLAHTIKGAAGMIEAAPLRDEAQALEQLLRDGGGDPAWRLARLERALDLVMRELDAAEGAAQAAQPVQQDDCYENVTARLRTLLEDGNGDAVDLVQDAAASLTRELGEERYRQIAAAIEVFDFEDALALLER
jgi:HPt (histidine-containing phosphotransfer) domain-containing protein